MLVAVTVMVAVPLGLGGMNTLSTLFRTSATPPVDELRPVNTLPRYVLPFRVTVRSRLLLKLLPVVLPGASVQARVTRNGLVGSALVLLKVRVWPVAVNRSAGTSSRTKRAVPSNAKPTFR